MGLSGHSARLMYPDLSTWPCLLAADRSVDPACADKYHRVPAWRGHPSPNQPPPLTLPPPHSPLPSKQTQYHPPHCPPFWMQSGFADRPIRQASSRPGILGGTWGIRAAAWRGTRGSCDDRPGTEQLARTICGTVAPLCSSGWPVIVPFWPGTPRSISVCVCEGGRDETSMLVQEMFRLLTIKQGIQHLEYASLSSQKKCY